MHFESGLEGAHSVFAIRSRVFDQVCEQENDQRLHSCEEFINSYGWKGKKIVVFHCKIVIFHLFTLSSSLSENKKDNFTFVYDKKLYLDNKSNGDFKQ